MPFHALVAPEEIPLQAFEAPDVMLFHSELAEGEALPPLPPDALPADLVLAVPVLAPEKRGKELATAPPKFPVKRFAPVLAAALGFRLIALAADLPKEVTDLPAELIALPKEEVPALLAGLAAGLIGGTPPFDIIFSFKLSLLILSNSLSISQLSVYFMDCIDFTISCIFWSTCPIIAMASVGPLDLGPSAA
jgi:hypothetical protein